MVLIGLTGGIASGKSVVARRLVERGAVHVDADLLAREVVEPGTDGLAAIEREFGADVIAADGTLNRPALGAIIFSDPKARLALNAITHPAVWKRAKELIAAAEAENPAAVIVYDVPLLVESAGSRPMTFDLVAVVNAAADVRLERMIELRGITREDAAQRIASQATDAERLAVADVVIDTNGSMDETMRQTDALWANVSARASGMSDPLPKLE